MRLLRTPAVTALAIRLAALVAAAGLISGCCNEVDVTLCIEWDEPAACPAPDAAAERLPDT